MKTLLRYTSCRVVDVIFCVIVFCVLCSASSLPDNGVDEDSLKFILDTHNLGPLKTQFSGTKEGHSNAPKSTLILAANRTKRPDILRGFKKYHDGWNITNRHYWASVGYTGSFAFILAVLWFISFSVAMLVHYCCGYRININRKKSHHVERICLIVLIVFTCFSAIGCILLSVGQGKFHGEVVHTLKYVVNQSDYTVETLNNVTEYLTLAKTIKIAQIILPTDVMDNIDKLNVDLNNAADTLSEKTTDNSTKIKRVFNAVRTALITVAAVMLLLSLIGLVLSILGHQHAILIFIVSGWILVTVTFVLCGVFVILNKHRPLIPWALKFLRWPCVTTRILPQLLYHAISDTCLSMEQWVNNPQAETALGNILPCVDQGTTNKTLYQSKQVINNIVTVVNQFIYTYANSNSPQSGPFFYNQSGPMMPPLCYPFDSQLQDRECGSWEVPLVNASEVWKKYECSDSTSGWCTTVGRVTPDIYTQLVGAVNESYALEHYTPPLLSLQDCKFVRDTFQNITSDHCPPLEHHLKLVNAGLGLISVGVLLCLVLWLLYANRPRREEAFVSSSSPTKESSRSNKSLSNSNGHVVVSSPISSSNTLENGINV